MVVLFQSANISETITSRPARARLSEAESRAKYRRGCAAKVNVKHTHAPKHKPQAWRLKEIFAEGGTTQTNSPWLSFGESNQSLCFLLSQTC
jgi:hypothetical protein